MLFFVSDALSATKRAHIFSKLQISIFMKRYFLTSLSFFFILVLIFSACQKKKNREEQPPMVEGPRFPYLLQKYSYKYKLPKDLREISGISSLGNNLIACVQDELGYIYIYSQKEEKVLREIKFAGDGDYEDIEVVGNDGYVLRSDGVIYKIEDLDGSNRVSTILTPFDIDNDTEGLCYDQETNSLWIACKAASGIGKHIPFYRTAYAIDLKTNYVDEQPVVSINIPEIQEIADARIGFEPSCIAIHPFTGDKYLISSVDKVLIVLDIQNEIKHLRSLNHKGFKQPEGIFFDTNGDMFISNEGRGGKGNILRFDYIANE